MVHFFGSKVKLFSIYNLYFFWKWYIFACTLSIFPLECLSFPNWSTIKKIFVVKYVAFLTVHYLPFNLVRCMWRYAFQIPLQGRTLLPCCGECGQQMASSCQLLWQWQRAPSPKVTASWSSQLPVMEHNRVGGLAVWAQPFSAWLTGFLELHCSLDLSAWSCFFFLPFNIFLYHLIEI